mmetsp:Transcript_31310/g.73005  ORF Transcript_31310/g.73005 Transcript_31310/m.73005 type:complete len:323 (-) Transcript_31310:1464-2432(-)
MAQMLLEERAHAKRRAAWEGICTKGLQGAVTEVNKNNTRMLKSTASGWGHGQNAGDLTLVPVYGAWPIEIPLHRVMLQLSEDMKLSVIELHSLQKDLAKHRITKWLRNQEASGIGACFGPASHSIMKAASVSHNRQSTVRLGNHLREATRLIPRRHQHQVTASHHPVLCNHIEVHRATYTPRVALCNLFDHGSVQMVTLTHEDDLRAATRIPPAVTHQPSHCLDEHVNTFLPSKSPNVTQEHCTWVYPKSRTALEHGLTTSSSINKVCGCVVLLDIQVVRWIPASIYAIENTHQPQRLRLLPREAVETASSELRLDLIGIGR